MRYGTLTTNERAETGYTLWVEITADDLTTIATATAQTLTPGPKFAIGDFVPRVTTVLTTAFADASDSAFNDDTMSVGDSVGGVATILAAIQLNVNGTEILNKTAVPTGTPATGFTAATNLTITFNSMTAKALNDLDTGVLRVFLNVNRPVNLANTLSAGPILTK